MTEIYDCQKYQCFRNHKNPDPMNGHSIFMQLKSFNAFMNNLHRIRKHLAKVIGSVCCE